MAKIKDKMYLFGINLLSGTHMQSSGIWKIDQTSKRSYYFVN
jgi:hypothetical protein